MATSMKKVPSPLLFFVMGRYVPSAWRLLVTPQEVRIIPAPFPVASFRFGYAMTLFAGAAGSAIGAWQIWRGGFWLWWLPLLVIAPLISVTAPLVFWEQQLDSYAAEIKCGPWFIFNKQEGLLQLPRLKMSIPPSDCERIEVVSGYWAKDKQTGIPMFTDWCVCEAHLILRSGNAGPDRVHIIGSGVAGETGRAAEAIGEATGLPVVRVKQKKLKREARQAGVH